MQMIIIKYNKKKYKEIVRGLVHALKTGKTVVYPTDTSYGLGADATNANGLRKVYKIKERGFNKPIHLVVPSVAAAKSMAHWTPAASRLAKRFWPGALTIVLPTREKRSYLKKLGAGTGTIGLRMPDNQVALDLAAILGAPITATSANPSNLISRGKDSYSARDVIKQFEKQKYRPDIILDAGRLPRRMPSTVVRISDGIVKILRAGPVTKKDIKQTLRNNKVRIVE
jgi:L-threonylcarbamoyladenylate synthase